MASTTTMGSSEGHVPARKILIPVDGSPHSTNAINWALKTILQHGDHVTVLACYECTGMPLPAILTGQEEHDRQKAMDQAENYRRAATVVQCAAAILEGKGFNVSTAVLEGDAGEQTVAAAAVIGADLVVMGSRGAGPLNRALGGSASDYCVHNCLCPVLVVRDAGKIEKEKAERAALGAPIAQAAV